MFFLTQSATLNVSVDFGVTSARPAFRGVLRSVDHRDEAFHLGALRLIADFIPDKP